MLGLAGGEWLAVRRANAVIGEDLLRAEFDGNDVGRLIGNLLLQFLEDVNNL